MQPLKITLEQAREAIPAGKLKTRAVQGWLASAENWTGKPAGAKVEIEMEDERWGTTFLLSIMHVGTGRSAAVFLRLNIPKDFGGVTRRTSLRRSDFIAGKKVKNAMWIIKA